MKIASILTLAAALCAVSVNAAAVAGSDANPTDKHHVTKHTTTTTKHAKPTPHHAATKKPKTTTKATAKPTTVPKAKDPCATLAKEGMANGLTLTYESVKGCYEAQSFKADVADKTLTALENSLGNFYAFVDLAKTGPTTPAGSPLKTPAIDIMGQLAKIRATKYKNDYEFQLALTYLTLSANDGHLSYSSKFAQQALTKVD